MIIVSIIITCFWELITTKHANHCLSTALPWFLDNNQWIYRNGQQAGKIKQPSPCGIDIEYLLLRAKDIQVYTASSLLSYTLLPELLSQIGFPSESSA